MTYNLYIYGSSVLLEEKENQYSTIMSTHQVQKIMKALDDGWIRSAFFFLSFLQARTYRTEYQIYQRARTQPYTTPLHQR